MSKMTLRTESKCLTILSKGKYIPQDGFETLKNTYIRTLATQYFQDLFPFITAGQKTLLLKLKRETHFKCSSNQHKKFFFKTNTNHQKRAFTPSNLNLHYQLTV